MNRSSVSNPDFADVLNWAPIGMFRVRKDGTFLWANRQLADMLGHGTTASLMAMNIERDIYCDPAQRRALLVQVEKKGTGLRLEAQWRSRSGAPVWVELTGHPVHLPGEQEVCFEGLAIDITERKLAEEARRESERKMSTLMSNLPGIAYRCRNDRAWTMEFISDGCMELTGYGAYDLTFNRLLSFNDLIVPGDRDAVWEKVQTAIRASEPYQLLYRIRTADDHIKWVWERGEAIRTAAGEVEALEGFISDVTERRSAEERIREQAALLDRAQDAIYVEDLEGTIRFWNRGAEHIYGWTAAEACGRNGDALFRTGGPERAEMLSCVLNSEEWVGERSDRSKSGRAITVQCRCSLVRDDRGRPASILVINTDITEKKDLERQFLRAQRMESIGTLASGIAHDLNNVLAPITMSITMLRKKMTDPSGRRWLDTIDASAVRAAGIVRQVLGFGRGVSGERIPLEPRHIIREVMKITRETFPKSIAIEADIPRNLWSVEADPTQLHQVLLNLCVNARDAMEGGGMLRITTENVTLDEHYARLHLDAKPGRYVAMSVADNGTGIPGEILDRVFDPFFTTKPPGKGTGLGLPTVMAIVKAHGGFVNLYSEPGRGTTFRIYLPAREQSSAAPARAEEEKAPVGHGETILVVDDEPSIREITRGMLDSNGYNSLIASDGSQALELFRSRKQEIRAIITDLMMPNMDGSSAIREFKNLEPSVRIIASSGFGASSELTTPAATGASMFLNKPYTAGALLRALDKVLHEPSDPA